MKHFLQALDQKGTCFGHIGRKIPGIGIEKLKAGVLNEPRIKQLVNDIVRFIYFVNCMRESERNQ